MAPAKRYPCSSCHREFIKDFFSGPDPESDPRMCLFCFNYNQLEQKIKLRDAKMEILSSENENLKRELHRLTQLKLPISPKRLTKRYSPSPPPSSHTRPSLPDTCLSPPAFHHATLPSSTPPQLNGPFPSSPTLNKYNQSQNCTKCHDKK